MKPRAAVLATAFLASSMPLPAAIMYWDGTDSDIATPGDGASAGNLGTWNTTIQNWDQGLDLAHVAWDNSFADTAVFGGVASSSGANAIFLDSNVTVGALSFTSAHYIDLKDFQLTINGNGITGSAAATIATTGTTTPGSIIVASDQTWSNTTNTMLIDVPVSTGANLLTLSVGDNKLDVKGTISGSGGLTVNSSVTSGTNPSTTGNPTISNDNVYTGTTTVNGWIWLNSGGVSAFGTDTSDLLFNNGGVRLSGTGTIDRGISISGTCGISKPSGETIMDGVISGTGNFQVSGNFGQGATVTLRQVNTFTGDCISGPDGVLRLAHVDALPSQNLRWADNNGRSKIDLTDKNLAYVIGGLKSNGNASNNLDLGTALAEGGNGLVSFGANDQSNTYVGILSGGAGFKKIGTGTQTLIGANAYTGNTVIAAGTLKLGKITGQTGVNCTTGASGSNVKRLTGLGSVANLYIGQAVTGTLIPLGARITNINTTSQVTLDLGPTSPSTATTVNFPDILGSITTSPLIDVQAGATLDVSAYPWTLEAAQTLAGNGTVTGAITAAGILSPGSSTGTLTTGDVTLTGTYACELDGATCDTLAAGALVLSGATLDINVISPPTAASYVIATYTGTAPAPFATVLDLPAGYAVDYSTPGQIKLSSGATSPYDTWAAAKGLAGGAAAAGADPDGDDIDNALEFVLGGEPNPANPGADSSALLPTAATTATHLVFTFRRSDVALTQPGLAIAVEYGSTLAGWTTAQHGTDGVTITVNDDAFGSGIDRVEVALPKTLAVGSSIFARLKVTP